jgi:hypothetical protein
MEASAVYICLAAIAALLIPMRAPREAFKIEVDPGVQWSNVVSTCKKPFTYVSTGLKNKIYIPAKKLVARSVPFKPYFRKRKRKKMSARMESMRRRQEKEQTADRQEGIGKYRKRNTKPETTK